MCAHVCVEGGLLFIGLGLDQGAITHTHTPLCTPKRVWLFNLFFLIFEGVGGEALDTSMFSGPTKSEGRCLKVLYAVFFFSKILKFLPLVQTHRPLAWSDA